MNHYSSQLIIFSDYFALFSLILGLVTFIIIFLFAVKQDHKKCRIDKKITTALTLTFFILVALITLKSPTYGLVIGISYCLLFTSGYFLYTYKIWGGADVLTASPIAALIAPVLTKDPSMLSISSLTLSIIPYTIYIIIRKETFRGKPTAKRLPFVPFLAIWAITSITIHALYVFSTL